MVGLGPLVSMIILAGPQRGERHYLRHAAAIAASPFLPLSLACSSRRNAVATMIADGAAKEERQQIHAASRRQYTYEKHHEYRLRLSKHAH